METVIEFELPLDIGFTIYTKSNCPYCTKAKQLLNTEIPTPKIINCDNYLQTSREPFLKFIEKQANKQHKTFPIIFKNGIFLGGFTETKDYIEKQSIPWDNMGFS